MVSVPVVQLGGADEGEEELHSLAQNALVVGAQDGRRGLPDGLLGARWHWQRCDPVFDPVRWLVVLGSCLQTYWAGCAGARPANSNDMHASARDLRLCIGDVRPWRAYARHDETRCV